VCMLFRVTGIEIQRKLGSKITTLHKSLSLNTTVIVRKHLSLYVIYSRYSHALEQYAVSPRTKTIVTIHASQTIAPH